MRLKGISFMLAGLMLAALPAQAAVMAFNGQYSNDTPPVAPNPACAPGSGLVDFNPGNSTAAGTSNFGAFGPSLTHCIVFSTLSWSGGSFTFTFANDAFWGTTSGQLVPRPGTTIADNYATYVVTGGSGRFLGASGSLAATGTLDRAFPRPLNQSYLTGTLDMPAVPEPATWAMMIAGFGLTGTAMRRRPAAIA